MKVKEWTDALRSGEYKQGYCLLRSKRRDYCCIGVCLDLMGAEWDEGERRVKGCGFAGQYIDNGSLPQSLEFEDFTFDKKRLEKLAAMNDEGVYFEEIADVIEEWCDES